MTTPVRSTSRSTGTATVVQSMESSCTGWCARTGSPSAPGRCARRRAARIFRDVGYDALGVVVELDGRLDHALLRDRDRDLDRDLDAVIDQKVTVRLGWGQVFGRPCRTASRVHQLLAARGHPEPLRRCLDCP